MRANALAAIALGLFLLSGGCSPAKAGQLDGHRNTGGQAMSESLTKLKEAIASFEKVQRKHRRQGAQDTEPDAYFQWTLIRASKGQPANVSSDVDAWELYEGRGAAQAVNDLAKAAQAAVDAVRATPLGESEQVLQHLRAYCWRVS